MSQIDLENAIRTLRDCFQGKDYDKLQEKGEVRIIEFMWKNKTSSQFLLNEIEYYKYKIAESEILSGFQNQKC